MSITLLRNEFYSIYYHLKDLFANWSSAVSVLWEWKDAASSIPCCVVSYQDAEYEALELGNKINSSPTGLYLVELVARNKDELLDMISKAVEFLAENIILMDYANAFPGESGYDPDVQKMGSLSIGNLRVDKIEWQDLAVADIDKFRAEITFNVQRP